VVAFVAEATMFGFGNVKNAKKMALTTPQIGAHDTPPPFFSMHSIIFQYVCDDQNL
jgi:hypothetical protein